MKKIISILLSVIMSVSAFSFAYGGEQEYTDALKNVKELFDIKDYESFDYSVTTMIDKTVYRFSWVNSPDDKLNINADNDMNIYYYDLIEPTDEENSERISQNEAKVIADDFLKKVSKEYSYYKQGSVLYDIDDITYTYDAYLNGYKVLLGSAYVTVDLKTKKVVYYKSDLPSYDLPSAAEKPISLEKAKEGFFSDDNVELNYESVKEDDKYILKPLYSVYNIYVNAVTGKLRNSEDEFNLNPASGGGGSASSAVVKETSLTEAELKEIDKLGEAVAKDEAIKLVNAKFKINIDISDKNIRTSYHKVEDGYKIAVVKYDENNNVVTNFGVNPDRTIASFHSEEVNISGYNAIKSYLKSIYPNADVPAELKKGNEPNYYVFYEKHNGIDDTSKWVSMTYSDEYKVSDVYYTNNKYEYEEFAKELTNDEIFDIAKDNVGLDLVYIPAKDGKLRLYYKFDHKFTVNAATKQALDWKGNEYKDEDFDSYIDVEGAWYEEIANALIYNNYSFEDNQFKGDQVVTGRDIIRLFKGKSVEDYKKAVAKSDYIQYADEPDAEITKYEAAKIIAQEFAQEKILKNGEFLQPFEDVDEEHTNVVAVCKALGAAKGYNGKFNGNDPITRAEMAAMIYYCIME